MPDRSVTRREFVRVGVAGTAGLALGGAARVGQERRPERRPPHGQGDDLAPPRGVPPMPERPLGRTGHRVRLFSLGGQAALEQATPGARDVSIAIINRAIDLGVNYIDTAASYGSGVSESRIGEVMARRRDAVFLASKTGSRTRDAALRQLNESLTLLKTDHLDLWQLHNIQTNGELDQVFGRGGAIEAFEQACREGMVRFLGITGHYDPDVLIRGISRYPFHSILMALNPADRHRLSFMEALLPLANSKRMGIIAMKIPARGRMFRPGGITTMKDAMSYVLSLPIDTVIVGCDTVRQVEENVAVAKGFERLPDSEMRRIEGLTFSYAADASWFKKS